MKPSTAQQVLEALRQAKKELHACQAVIHLRGGFDPAYVRDAQFALQKMSESIFILEDDIAAIEADAQPVEPVEPEILFDGSGIDEAEPVWVPVIDYEMAYEVSSNGEIRNKKTGNIYVRCTAGSGYIKADLTMNGIRKQTLAHRVVAESFLGKHPGMEINHKNGIKNDNRLTNLEWVSKSDNHRHKYYVLGKGTKPIKSTNIETGIVTYFESITDAERAHLSSWQICNCLKGRIESYKGCTWTYCELPKEAAPQEPAGWQPIATAPKDGTKYLAYSDYWGYFVENQPPQHYAGEWEFNINRNQWRGHAHSNDRSATHWMQLPSAPKATP